MLYTNKQIQLKSTGQVVIDASSAMPRGLRRTEQGYTQVLIPPSQPGHKASLQTVRNKNLRRSVVNVSTIKTRT